MTGFIFTVMILVLTEKGDEEHSKIRRLVDSLEKMGRNSIRVTGKKEE